MKSNLTSKNPLVSIVIRTKNEQVWIGKVLEKLYEQTFKDFEVIIVDSGSTDKTLEIIKKFPVKLIQIKPEEFNYSYALNIGGKHAGGKYLCIICANTIPISRTWIADGLKNFEDNRVAGVSGWYSGLPLGFLPTNLLEKLTKISFVPYQQEKKRFFPWMTNTNAIIRKDLWQQYPFDEKLKSAEDYDWASEMIARGYDIVKEPKFNVFHSHFLTGKPGYLARVPIWKKLVVEIDKRTRPRKSFTRLSRAST